MDPYYLMAIFLLVVSLLTVGAVGLLEERRSAELIEENGKLRELLGEVMEENRQLRGLRR